MPYIFFLKLIYVYLNVTVLKGLFVKHINKIILHNSWSCRFLDKLLTGRYIMFLNNNGISHFNQLCYTHNNMYNNKNNKKSTLKWSNSTL